MKTQHNFYLNNTIYLIWRDKRVHLWFGWTLKLAMNTIDSAAMNTCRVGHLPKFTVMRIPIAK